MKKFTVNAYYLDGYTHVSFDGTIARTKWAARTAYLKNHGFRWNRTESTWMKKGDSAEQIKIELDHLDAIKAAEQSHEKQPEKAPEKTTITIEQALTDPGLMERLAMYCMPKMTKECAQVLLGIVFDSVAQGRYIGGRLNENIA